MIGKKLGAAAVILDTRGRVLLVKHTYRPLKLGVAGEVFEEPGLGGER
jgi:hypothetical protein